MSRIGNRILKVPENVQVTISDTGLVKAKGPKGELELSVDPNIECKLEDGVITTIPKSVANDLRMKQGLYNALINNVLVGVSEGYKKSMELVGVGYKASSQGNILDLNPSNFWINGEAMLRIPRFLFLSFEDNKVFL